MPRSQSSKSNPPMYNTASRSIRMPSQPATGNQPTIQHPTAPSLGMSLGQSIKQGFGFGLGNSIAHSLMGTFKQPTNGQSVEQDTKITRSIGASSTQDMSGQIEYLQCMKEGGTEEVCKQYMN